MGNIADKVKEKVTGAKDKVVGAAKEGVSSTTNEREGTAGTDAGREEDPLQEYRSKEPMTPAKEKEHDPTAVKREMTEKIVDETEDKHE